MLRPNSVRGRLDRTVKHVCLRALLALVMVVLPASQLTCDKNNSPLDTREVSGSVQLPAGSSITPTSLSVISCTDEVIPGADGSFTVTATKAEKQQLILACTQNGNPILLGYIDPANPAAVEVSARSTAVAFALLNPLLLSSSKDQRDQYIATLQEHADFWPLVATIEALIVADPENALNTDQHPEVLSWVAGISADALQELGDTLISTCSEEHFAPYIEDASGDQVAFLNPTSVFYGAVIEGPRNGTKQVKPISNIAHWQWGFPPVYRTEPTRTNYKLGDGAFDIYFYRGWDEVTLDVFTDKSNPRYQPTWDNFTLGVYHIVDIIMSLPQTEDALDNLKIDWVKNEWIFGKMLVHVGNRDGLGLFSDFVSAIDYNKDEVVGWLKSKFGRAVKEKFLQTLAGYAGQMAVFMKGYLGMTEKLPFFLDMYNADAFVGFSVYQEEGQLKSAMLYSGPDQPASPNGPTHLQVNESGTYTCSATHPDGSEVRLIFFWGDGNIDYSDYVASGTSVQMSHAYTELGAHTLWVKAACAYGNNQAVSTASPAVTVFVRNGANQSPAPSGTPSGQTNVQLGQNCLYTAKASDPDGDDIQYRFLLGDIETSWSSSVPSGKPMTFGRTWSTQGMYDVKVRVRDIEDAESDWSLPLQVVVGSSGNQPPVTPAAPTGPDNGTVGIQYEFIAGTTDPEGDDIRYIFDWGDGMCDTTPYIGNGVTIGRYKTWWSANSYGVKVKAEDDNGAGSNWSASHYVNITSGGGNNPPNTPATPSGPDSGQVGQSYTFSSSATDPDGDQVAIRFDWGDGTYSDWSSYVSGGTTVSASHSWGSANTYQVKAQAKDDEGAESNWSSSHPVSIAGSQYPNRVVGTLTIPSFFITEVCILPNGQFLYLTDCFNHDTLFVVRTSDLTISAKVRLGPALYGMAASPDGSRLYVAKDESTLVLRTSDHAVLGRVQLPGDAHSVAVRPDGAYAYVSCYIGGDTVSVIRTSDNVRVRDIGVGDCPRGITILPNGTYAYVANWRDGTVSVIRLSDNTVTKTVTVGSNPFGLTVAPNGDYVYVANQSSGTVSVIRTSDNVVVDNIQVGSEPRYVAVLPNGQYLYVSRFFGESVAVIRTADNTVVETISTGNGNPCQLAVHPSGNFVYVAIDGYDGRLKVIGY